MNTAPTAMVRTTRRAGGIAAYPANGSVNKPSAAPVAQYQTVDVLVAKPDIGLGHVVRYGASIPTTTQK